MAEGSDMEETTLKDRTDINFMVSSKTTPRLLTQCDRLIGVPATLIESTLRLGSGDRSEDSLLRLVWI